MTPTVTVDTSRFDAAWKEYLPKTKRSLADAVNARTFYLMLRLYCLLPPKSPQASRNKVLDYLDRYVLKMRKSKKTGKYIGRNRALRVVHLIAQAKNAQSGGNGGKGLYGPTMRKAAGKLRRRAAGSVGYLKSAVTKAIKKLSPSFQQFGGTRRAKKGSAGVRSVAGNQALINLANQYGLPQENVAIHRGSSAYAFNAKAGFNPSSHVRMNIGLADNQVGTVEGIYAKAMQQAYNDEARELENHIAAALQAAFDGSESKGITVT
jgi:hypothetical protein